MWQKKHYSKTQSHEQKLQIFPSENPATFSQKKRPQYSLWIHFTRPAWKLKILGQTAALGGLKTWETASLDETFKCSRILLLLSILCNQRLLPIYDGSALCPYVLAVRKDILYSYLSTRQCRTGRNVVYRITNWFADESGPCVRGPIKKRSASKPYW
jgi:hypothetical protein